MPRHVDNPGFSQHGGPPTVAARAYAGVGSEAEVYSARSASYENTGEDYEEIDADDEASVAAAAAAAAASPARQRSNGGRGGGRSNSGAAHSTAPTNGRASAPSRTTATATAAATLRRGDGNGHPFAQSRNATLRGAETGDIDKQFAAIRKEKCNSWKQIGAVAMIVLVLIIAVVSLAKHSQTTDSVAEELPAEDGSAQASATTGNMNSPQMTTILERLSAQDVKLEAQDVELIGLKAENVGLKKRVQALETADAGLRVDVAEALAATVSEGKIRALEEFDVNQTVQLARVLKELSRMGGDAHSHTSTTMTTTSTTTTLFTPLFSCHSWGSGSAGQLLGTGYSSPTCSGWSCNCQDMMALLDTALARAGQSGSAIPCGGNGWTVFPSKAACNNAATRINNARGGAWSCNCGGEGCSGVYHLTGCTDSNIDLINELVYRG